MVSSALCMNGHEPVEERVDDCLEVALTPPPSGTAKRWNMVGNPFSYPVGLADVRVVVIGADCITNPDSDCTLSQAETDGYGSKTIHIWNGGSYDPYDDNNTPGMEGVVNPGEAFWYAVTDDTLAPGDMTMLIPAKAFTAQQAFNTLGAPAATRYAGLWKALGRMADLVVAPARAAGGGKGKPPKDGNAGQERRTARLAAKEWYVRLIADWPEGNLKDRGNVLGELADSVPGYDLHDLEELSPFSAPYLTIVFPHDDWGERAGSYASDYRALKKNKNEGDSWRFEVRSDQPGREITLRWAMQGDYPEAPTLIDLESGETVAVDPTVPDSYTFVMDAATHRFAWTY
jgi:hypothetical protein